MGSPIPPVFLMPILKQAQETVDRNQIVYGHPATHHQRTIAAINALLGEEYLRKPLTTDLWAKFMILDKLVRSMEFYKPDNMLDVAGYAETHEMIKESERDEKALRHLKNLGGGLAGRETLYPQPRDFRRDPDTGEHETLNPGQGEKVQGGEHFCPKGCTIRHQVNGAGVQ